MRIIISGQECKDKKRILCARRLKNARSKGEFCAKPYAQEWCRETCGQCTDSGGNPLSNYFHYQNIGLLHYKLNIY